MEKKIITNQMTYKNNFIQTNHIIISWVFRYGKFKFSFAGVVQPNFILITNFIQSCKKSTSPENVIPKINVLHIFVIQSDAPPNNNPGLNFGFGDMRRLQFP